MKTNIISSSLLAALCTLIVGCAPEKNSEVDESNSSEIEESVQAWQSIYFDWVAGEIPEGACGEGRVTLKSDRTLEVRDCDETRTAKISDAELLEFENAIEQIVSSIEKPISCNGVGIADYEQNWKMIDGDGRIVQIYHSSTKNTCGRVTNVDLATDFLYRTKEKYFPRTEEGVYQDEAG
jgi:hypothetical protein